MSRDMTPIYLPIMVSIVKWVQCDRCQAAHTSLFLDLTSLRKKGRCLEPKRKDRTSYNMCILCTYVRFMYDTSSVNTPHGRVGNGPGDLYIWVTQTSSSSFWLIAWQSSLINLTVGPIHHPFQSHAKIKSLPMRYRRTPGNSWQSFCNVL